MAKEPTPSGMRAYAQGRRDGQAFEQRHSGNVTVTEERGPLPLHDPIELRAFCLKSAIEMNGFGAQSEEVIGTARAFAAYITGPAGPHAWQEYNAHHNSCHFPGCTAEESEHLGFATKGDA